MGTDPVGAQNPVKSILFLHHCSLCTAASLFSVPKSSLLPAPSPPTYSCPFHGLSHSWPKKMKIPRNKQLTHLKSIYYDYNDSIISYHH